MWILFSPSEKKCLEHAKSQYPNKESQTLRFYQNFICKNGLEEALQAYKGLLESGGEAEIGQVFGVKNIVLDELALAQNLMESPLLPAVLRYVGVAFSALDFEHLDTKAQEYLRQHLLIFSNLFGLLRCFDKIPYYDLKQGVGFLWQNTKFQTKSFYAKNTERIWEYFINPKNEESQSPKNPKEALEFLDLRAGFYQKCLDLGKPPKNLKNCEILVYEPNFIKNGKVVSHYAKHYRGILLRACAQSQIRHLGDLENLYLEGLELDSVCQAHTESLRRVVLTYAIKSI